MCGRNRMKGISPKTNPKSAMSLMGGARPRLVRKTRPGQSCLHGDQHGAGPREVAEEPQQARAAQRSQYDPLRRALGRGLHCVETIKTSKAEGAEEAAQAVIAEPIDGRIFRVVGDRGSRGRGQVLAMPLEC